MSGRGGGSTNTIQKADPWEGVAGFLAGNQEAGIQGLYGRAYDWLNAQGPQYFPGQTLAPTDWMVTHAEDLALNRAKAGSPLLTQANEYFSKAARGDFLSGNATARGDFLNANPYLDAMVNASTRDINRNFTENVLPGVASQFAAGGRYGSGAQTGVLGRVSNDYTTNIGDIVSKIRGTNFMNERGLMESAIARERGFQTSAAGMLPTLANEDWANISRIAAIGEQRQGRRQDEINADIARWNYNENLPLSKLNAFASILQGTAGLGGMSSSTTGMTQPSNRLSSMLGGGLGGYALGSSLGAGAGLLAGGAAGAGGGAAAGAAGGAAAGAGMGSWAGPIGAGIGALLGLFL